MIRMFERIAVDIVDDIRSGRLNPGDKIETIKATKDRYSCGYYSVRRARLLLKDRLYIEKAGSKATIVTGFAPFL